MARAGISITKMPMLREAKQIYRCFSKSAEAGDDHEEAGSFTGSAKGRNNSKDSLTWIPHPRSGIYFPVGHERVMDDVPKGAATLGGRTYWLRNEDGVDKPDPHDDGHGDFYV